MLVSAGSLGISTPLEYITKSQNEKILAQRANDVSRRGNTGTSFREWQEVSYGTRIAGILCEKGQESNPSRILLFPFNPEEIVDTKGVNINSKTYNGFSFNDHVWASGGARTITFQLHFEATAAMNTPFFGRNTTYGDDQMLTLDDIYPRGTLDMTELLQSFMHPKQTDPNTPRFSNGGFVPSPKFQNIPVVVFAYGNYYLEGFVTEAPITHTLVDKNLIPRRSSAQVTFTVFEQTLIQFKTIVGNPVDSPVNDQQGDNNGFPSIFNQEGL